MWNQNTNLAVISSLIKNDFLQKPYESQWCHVEPETRNIYVNIAGNITKCNERLNSSVSSNKSLKYWTVR